MALALNVSVFQNQLERYLHFPPGIQDWVTDLGNVGKSRKASGLLSSHFKLEFIITTTMHPAVFFTSYSLHVLNLEGQNSAAPKYYPMIAAVSSSLLCVGGMGHVDLWWEVFHGRGSGTG